ncbi:tyrosine-type recombinase/integrase [Photorhabdus asymbiotica]|uniref:tyrosine-type recombinase/integrase n=1 Tax=Photorhabdus asymbiotica TaxID=291112 RepID=UPI003DA79C4C
MQQQTKDEAYKASEHVGQHVIDYLNEISKQKLITLYRFDENDYVSQVIKLWIKLSLLLTRRRPEIAISSILTHLLPVVGEEKLINLNRLQLNRVFNNLLAEGKIHEAKRVFALTKQFLSWCESQGYIEHSPLTSMQRKDVGGKPPEPRSRSLSDAEIWVFWHGLDMWEISAQVKWALRLCLVSARRPDEVIRANRSEFDFERGIWRQGKRNKSRRDHTLPLSPLMRLCVEKLEEANIWNSPWLCPSPKNPRNPLSKGSPAQVVRRMVRDVNKFGLKEFLPRDLRRTARTKLAALGVQNDVARKIMNHALEGIDRIYDKHDYFEQMKEGLNLLSSSIQGIISEDSYRGLKHNFEGEILELPNTSFLYCQIY